MHLRRVGYIVGAVVLIGAAFMFARASISQGDGCTQSLVIPLFFAAGSEKTFQVTPKINRNFELVINMEGNQSKAGPTSTDIAWEILDGSNVVAQGSSADRSWQNRWGTYEQRLGTFPGHAGRQYTLKLQANREATQLDSLAQSSKSGFHGATGKATERVLP
jgi:hypothetical protein